MKSYILEKIDSTEEDKPGIGNTIFKLTIRNDWFIESERLMIGNDPYMIVNKYRLIRYIHKIQRKLKYKKNLILNYITIVIIILSLIVLVMLMY